MIRKKLAICFFVRLFTNCIFICRGVLLYKYWTYKFMNGRLETNDFILYKYVIITKDLSYRSFQNVDSVT